MTSRPAEQRAARRAIQQAAALRRTEDRAIAIDLVMRSIPDIDGFARALEGSGLAPRLVGAPRSDLARRRGGRR
jgi:hypothetical protein